MSNEPVPNQNDAACGQSGSTDGLGVSALKWPEGYCTAPDGSICPPSDKAEDFNFGYEIGFQEAWKIMNDAIRVRDANRATSTNP